MVSYMIKVSIIIPVYNVERYLEECLESALNQTLKDIEIICINDGSSDKSLEILNKYESRYDNITVMSNENKGQGYCRNKGLKVSRGEYIYFLDSDDYIESDAMEIAYNECKDNSLDILTFDANFFYDKDYCGDYRENLDRSACLSSDIKLGQEFIVEASKNNCFRTESCINLYRKEFLIDYKVKFSEQRIYEDIIQVFRGYVYAKRVKYIPNVLFNRRIRNGSAVTSSMSELNIYGYYIASKQLYDIYLENDEKLQVNSKCVILNYIRLYNMRSIQLCDVLGLLEYRKKIIKYIVENIDIINLKLDLLINSPKLFYNYGMLEKYNFLGD